MVLQDLTMMLPSRLDCPLSLETAHMGNTGSQGSKRTVTRKYQPVADRQKSLEPVPSKANFTLFAAREMYGGMGGKEFCCTISGYRRTRIFEFPGIDFHPDGDERHHKIYSSPFGSSVCRFRSGGLLRELNVQ